MESKASLQLSLDDVKYIFGNQYEQFIFLTKNVFCRKCKSGCQSEITEYSISINHLNDIVLDGFCKNCNGSVCRHIETGDNAEFASRIFSTRAARKFSQP